jgi:hypothetical protein
MPYHNTNIAKVQAWLWHVNIVNTRLSDHRQNQPKERPICKVEYCTGERKEVENPVEANAMRCFVFVAVGLSVREGKSDFIGKYLSSLRKLDHIIAPKEGFEAQL